MIEFATDPQVWDNTKTLNLGSVRNTGSYTTTVTGCKQQAVTASEKNPSFGALVGAEVQMLVPHTSLPTGFEPKPRDYFALATDPATQYTVQRVEKRMIDGSGPQVYALRGLNLAIAYDLQDKVTIERPEIVYDTTGAEVKFWPSTDGRGQIIYPNVPARLQEQSREITDANGIHGFRGNYTCFVGWQVNGVTMEDRIKWVKLGVTYYLNIIGLHNPERIDELPALDCQLAP